jgi:hypothetical protein
VARGRATERTKAGNDDIELTGSRSSINDRENGGLAMQPGGLQNESSGAEQEQTKAKLSSRAEGWGLHSEPKRAVALRCGKLCCAVQCDAMRCCVAKTETRTSQFHGPAGRDEEAALIF